MVRKFVFAFVVMAFSVGILSAAEMFGRITKVDGNKITFQEFKKGEKGEAKTFTVTEKAKVQLAKGFPKKDEPGEATDLEGGLKNKMFTSMDAEKGVFARIVTNDKDEVTEIRAFEFKGFGGKGGKKKKDSGQ